MKFSLRTLLALAMLSGLAFAVYGSLSELIAKRAEEQELRKYVEVMASHQQTLFPASSELPKHRREEYESLRQQRTIAMQSVKDIQKRYAEITPREGKVLSLRTVPQLRRPRKNPAVRFRVWIPDARPIWLKYGVVNQRRSVHDVNTLESIPIEGFDSGNFFEHAGPFGIELSPGMHLIDVHVSKIVSDQSTITVSLDENALLKSTLSAPLLDTAGNSHISGREQIDYTPKRKTPWLISYNFEYKDEVTNTETELEQRFTIWLAESKGISTDFPGTP